MDLSIYKKEAEKNRLLLEKKAKKALQAKQKQELKEKELEQQKIERAALEIFNTIPSRCAEAAKHGQEVIDSYLEMYREQGKSLPQPKSSLQLLQAA